MSSTRAAIAVIICLAIAFTLDSIGVDGSVCFMFGAATGLGLNSVLRK